MNETLRHGIFFIFIFVLALITRIVGYYDDYFKMDLFEYLMTISFALIVLKLTDIQDTLKGRIF